MKLISWLLSVHMVLFFLDGNPRKERAAITGGLGSLATLTTPLMAVMQPAGLLSVSAMGDSRSGQQPQGKSKNPRFVTTALVKETVPALGWRFDGLLIPITLSLFFYYEVWLRQFAGNLTFVHFVLRAMLDESAVRQSEAETGQHCWVS